MPHVLERVSAYGRAMAALLHTGAARHHNGNPSDTLRLEKLYGTPVLLSGVASFVLSKKEMCILYQQHKLMLCRLQKMNINTPDCVIFFTAGQLPISAIIHLRQFGPLGMIAHLAASSPLHQTGINILLSAKKEKSWFQQVCELFWQYDIPEHLTSSKPPERKIH